MVVVDPNTVEADRAVPLERSTKPGPHALLCESRAAGRRSAVSLEAFLPRTFQPGISPSKLSPRSSHSGPPAQASNIDASTQMVQTIRTPHGGVQAASCCSMPTQAETEQTLSDASVGSTAHAITRASEDYSGDLAVEKVCDLAFVISEYDEHS